MNRSEWIWVIIKLFGIYMVVLAILEVPTIIGAIEYLATTHNWGHNVDEADKLTTWLKQAYESEVSILLTSSLRVLVYSAAGLYFIRSGKWFFKIIAKSPLPTIPNSSDHLQ